jgi:hypothetical protein
MKGSDFRPPDALLPGSPGFVIIRRERIFGGRYVMGKFLAVLGGLIAMAAGLILVIAVWPKEFIHLVFGFIPPVLFFSGLIALIAGISSIKDAQRTKKLEEETIGKKEEEPKA